MVSAATVCVVEIEERRGCTATYGLAEDRTVTVGAAKVSRPK